MGELDWRTLRELTALRSRLRGLLERSLIPPSPPLLGEAGFEPAVDVWESEGEIVVEAELPGFRSADIDVRIEAGVLVLSGSAPDAAEPETRVLRLERPRGRFQRRIALPADVAGDPTASLERGVLEVRIPRPGGRQIPIERGAR